MKYVKTGAGRSIPLISLLAILAISLTINLPGLAVSPMLGHLQKVFHSSQLESQLVTSLPNMVMIPIVLIAGRIATERWQTAVLIAGLLIFLAGGIGCFIASSMTELIVMSCIIGVGCGFVVPIAAGMISEWFVSSPRQRDLGLKSMVSNAVIIIANLYVGWVALRSWHAAFAVYLVPIIPLLLAPFLTRRFILAHAKDCRTPQEKEAEANSSDPDAIAEQAEGPHFQGRRSLWMLVRVILLYMIMTYATCAISYYSPFLMQHFGMSTTEVGVVTALYYMFCAGAGALVAKVRKFTGNSTMYVCLGMCGLSLAAIGLTHNVWIYMIASAVAGFGYGTIQPIIYNKTTYIAPTHKLGTRYFGYVLAANYVGIMMVPYIDQWFSNLFPSMPGAEFIGSALVIAALILWAVIERKNYTFQVSADTSAPTQAQLNS